MCPHWGYRGEELLDQLLSRPFPPLDFWCSYTTFLSSSGPQGPMLHCLLVLVHPAPNPVKCFSPNPELITPVPFCGVEDPSENLRRAAYATPGKTHTPDNLHTTHHRTQGAQNGFLGPPSSQRVSRAEQASQHRGHQPPQYLGLA